MLDDDVAGMMMGALFISSISHHERELPTNSIRAEHDQMVGRVLFT